MWDYKYIDKNREQDKVDALIHRVPPYAKYIRANHKGFISTIDECQSYVDKIMELSQRHKLGWHIEIRFCVDYDVIVLSGETNSYYDKEYWLDNYGISKIKKDLKDLLYLASSITKEYLYAISCTE